MTDHIHYLLPGPEPKHSLLLAPVRIAEEEPVGHGKKRYDVLRQAERADITFVVLFWPAPYLATRPSCPAAQAPPTGYLTDLEKDNATGGRSTAHHSYPSGRARSGYSQTRL